MDAHFWLGDFEISQGYFDEAIALYDDASDVRLMANYSFDMKITNLIYASHFQWILGYPERSLQTKKLVDAWAQRLDHPFMYAFAYTWGTGPLHYRGDIEEHRLQVEKGLQVSREIGFPHFEGQAELWCAWNRASRGDLSEDNLALFESAITHFAGTGSGILVPYFRALQAQALASRGEISKALGVLQAALELVDTLGERSHAAEIHRIRAGVLRNEPSATLDQAEYAYKTALEIARQQHAKSWELRTAISYAHLMRDQGRMHEARELLKPIYDWFTEGFDTEDLKSAKALLHELERG